MSISKQSRARKHASEVRRAARLKRKGSLDTAILHDRPLTTPRRRARKLVA